MKITKPEVHETPATTPSADAASNTTTLDAFSYLLSQVVALPTPTADAQPAADTADAKAITSTKTADYRPKPAVNFAADMPPIEAVPVDEVEKNFLNQYAMPEAATSAAPSMQPIDKLMPAEANAMFLQPFGKNHQTPATVPEAQTTTSQLSVPTDQQTAPVVDTAALTPLLSQWQAQQQTPTTLEPVTAKPSSKPQSVAPPAIAELKSVTAETKLLAASAAPDTKSAEIFQQVTHWVNTSITLPAVQHPSETTLYTVQTKTIESPPPLSHAEILPMALDNLGKETHQAKINLYPPELGHLVATIKVDKNTAELQILTATQQVKEIVQAQLPQLHEHFQQADIHLTHVQIESALSGDHPNQHHHANTSTDDPSELATNTMTQPHLSLEKSATQSDNIIDTYA